MRRPTDNEFSANRTLLGDTLGLAAICFMVLVGLTLPGLS